MLDRVGFRFMFFETKELEGITQLGLDSDHHWVVPHPVARQKVERTHDTPLTVGIIGHYRPEKGMDDVLDVLLAKEPTFHLIVGVPNIGSFEVGSKYGKGNPWFELRDTSAAETYCATLAECNVVLLCYTAEGYRFRASGIIADASACGTAVLVPRFPVLEHQIRFPSVVGECFEDLVEVPDCIGRVADRQRSYTSAFTAYREGRGAIALAKQLDQLTMGMER